MNRVLACDGGVIVVLVAKEPAPGARRTSVSLSDPSVGLAFFVKYF